VVENAPMSAAIATALPMNCQAERPEARATMNSSRRDNARNADIAPTRTENGSICSVNAGSRNSTR
jgi:hypothetical protein